MAILLYLIACPMSPESLLNLAENRVEQCFAESKTELGMDQYEVRKYPGWHHHLLTTMLAISFCGISSCGWGKKAPALTVSQLRTILDVVLPLRTYTIEAILTLVARVQQRHHCRQKAK